MFTVAYFCFFHFFNQASSYQAAALLNMQPLAVSLKYCSIYLSYFSGRQGSCSNLHMETEAKLDASPGEGKVEITNVSGRRKR